MATLYEIVTGPTLNLSNLLGFYKLHKKVKIAIAHALAESSSKNRVAPFWGKSKCPVHHENED